jgi:hypothetical protein
MSKQGVHEKHHAPPRDRNESGEEAYPTLKARAIAHAQMHSPTKILIEDAGVGTALVPELQNHGFTAIAVQVEQNKQTRMSVQSGKDKRFILDRIKAAVSQQSGSSHVRAGYLSAEPARREEKYAPGGLRRAMPH